MATLLILASLKRSSAAVRSGVIFAGTLGAIVLPVTVGILPPISLPSLISRPSVESIPLENVSNAGEDRAALIGHEVAPEVLHHADNDKSPVADVSGSPWWVSFLVWLWVSGGLVFLTILALRIRSVLRLRSRSQRLPVGHQLTLEANTASARMGCGRELDVRISAMVKVPSAIGLGLNTIILPVEFERMGASSRWAVLIHECAHLRRRDSLVQMMILFCRCIHWFNPLFLALDRAFNAEAEKACDDQVIGSGISPEAYSEAILGYFQAASADTSGAIWNSAASGFYPCPQLDRQLRGRKKMMLNRIRRMVDPAARRTRLGALLGWSLVGVSSVGASVLGALVFVPTYEWRYQLAERELPFADQLVACWRMDEIRDQQTPDAGPGIYSGRVEGGTLDDQGKLDRAVYLDGDDFVDMGDRFSGLDYPITLSAWVRADDTGDRVLSSQNIVWLGGGGPGHYIYIGLNRGRPSIKSRFRDVSVLTGKNSIADGQWHHLTGVFLSESHRLLYLDGDLIGEDTRYARKPPTFRIQVGRNGRKSYETSYVEGAVDDVRVYQAALDQAAVREIMKGDFSLVAARHLVGQK
ncbi:MAG: M56 family metallopeptidase [Verrucomicrobiaceae bacterium]